jgi:hypothetical protein
MTAYITSSVTATPSFTPTPYYLLVPTTVETSNSTVVILQSFIIGLILFLCLGGGLYKYNKYRNNINTTIYIEPGVTTNAEPKLSIVLPSNKYTNTEGGKNATAYLNSIINSSTVTQTKITPKTRPSVEIPDIDSSLPGVPDSPV